MSFISSDLSVLAYANKFTLWHYTTTDSAVTSTGYFNKATKAAIDEHWPSLAPIISAVGRAF